MYAGVPTDHAEAVHRVRSSHLAAVALVFVCAVPPTALAGSARDIRKVAWREVAVPGAICGAKEPIRLHNGRAVVASSRWRAVPRVTVTAGWNPLVYGNLDGIGQDEAALVVGCSNGGGTASAYLAFAQVIFAVKGRALRVVGVVVPQQRQRPNTLPTLLTVRIARGKVIAHEAWYGPKDGTCCPSGRTTTVWRYVRGTLRAGAPRVTRLPSG